MKYIVCFSYEDKKYMDVFLGDIVLEKSIGIKRTLYGYDAYDSRSIKMCGFEFLSRTSFKCFAI